MNVISEGARYTMGFMASAFGDDFGESFRSEYERRSVEYFVDGKHIAFNRSSSCGSFLLLDRSYFDFHGHLFTRIQFGATENSFDRSGESVRKRCANLGSIRERDF